MQPQIFIGTNIEKVTEGLNTQSEKYGGEDQKFEKRERRRETRQFHKKLFRGSCDDNNKERLYSEITIRMHYQVYKMK